MISEDLVRLRDARDGDCPALTALCLRSKASWGYDTGFMARCREALHERNPTDRPARVGRNSDRSRSSAPGR